MHRPFACLASAALTLAIVLSLCADQGLSQVEIAKLGKAATALVESKATKTYASSFCIHPNGLFITNAHAVLENGAATIIVNPGEKSQKALSAKIMRWDVELDLALLSVEGEKGLPALALGSSEGLRELESLVTCGFTFGTGLALDKGSYPAATITTSKVTALRKKDGELHRIQLDGAIQPGSSGGPVLDRSSKVVGVVVAGVKGTGVNFAIPVSHVRRLVETPDVQFLPPAIKPGTSHQPALFQAKAYVVLPDAKPIDLELILTSEGKERRHKMELKEGTYRASAVPVSPSSRPDGLRVTITYANGALQGTVSDRAIKVDGKEMMLSSLRSIRWGMKPRTVFADGRSVEGPVTGLEALEAQVGPQKFKLDLTSLVVLQIENPLPSVVWTLVARQDGKEVKRLEGKLDLGDPTGAVTVQSFLDKERVTLPLPATVTDVAVGGGGKYLVLHLPKTSKLAVFEVGQAKVIKEIPTAEDGIKFAAGSDKLMIVRLKEKVLERWSFASFEREATMPLDMKVPVVGLAMGSGSSGPLLVEGCDWPRLGDCAFIDIGKMKKIDVKSDPNPVFSTDPRGYARASADGRVFAHMGPRGIETCCWTETEFHHSQGRAGTNPVPGTDGKVIYTDRGRFTTDLKSLPGPAMPCLPAQQQDYFLTWATAGTAGTVTIYREGMEQALFVLKNVEGLVGEKGQEPTLPVSKRVFLIPSAKLLVVIPPGQDKLLLYRIELPE